MKPQSRTALLLSFAGSIACITESEYGGESNPAEFDAPEELGEAQLEGQSQALASSSGYAVLSWEVLPSEPSSSLANLLAHLPLLQGRNIALSLHWPAAELSDPARWEVVDAARALGIPVYPWLTLPEAATVDQRTPGRPGYDATGYFPNSTNYNTWIASSQALMFLWRAQGYAPTTMVVDFEMRKEKLHVFDELSSRGDVVGVVNLLRANTNRTQHAAALAAYRRYVDHAHNLGFKVAVSTLLPILEDYVDGDDSLRQGFNVPLDDHPRSGGAIPWDSVNFQAHRSLYRKSFANLSPYFVYDYGRMAVRYFGSKAGLDIGLTHGGISEASGILYTGPTELRKDAGAAARAGIPSARIGVYSLLGVATSAAPDRWFEAPIAYDPPWFGDPATAAAHVTQQTLDRLLL